MSTAVLREIGAGDLPQVLVYNKIDLIDVRAKRRRCVARGDRLPAGSTGSTAARRRARGFRPSRGAGLDGLKTAIEQRLGAERIAG